VDQNVRPLRVAGRVGVCVVVVGGTCVYAITSRKALVVISLPQSKTKQKKGISIE